MSWMMVYLTGGAVILGCMVLLWLLSLAIKDASIVDIFWGTGFVIAAWVYGWFGDGFWARKAIVLTCATLWGLRLSIYIMIRNVGHGEDYRYVKWREESGKNWWWFSFIKVFLLQGTLMWLISSPLMIAQAIPTPTTWTTLDIAGVILWCIGFFFEAVGDYQLMKFKKDPNNKGKLLTTGLWKYTRHPNYFGDATLWWGFYIIALAVPNGFMTLFAPVLMTFFIVKVSGVAMLERGLKKTKPGYEDYVARTNAFFPWFPKKISSTTQE